MKKDLTLLILAAGMGSRFGGLKQIEPIGPNGEFLIDYSIYDAIKAGFNKVVFVIKKENEKVFKETIGNRIAGKIQVEYAFQGNDDLPDGFEYPKERIKPWGTSHAILAAKNLIHEPFLIINADDFYGLDAYQVAANFLKTNQDEYMYCVVGYPVENTLSENGSVKRGVCKEENGFLTQLIESKLEKIEGKILATPLDGSDSFEILDNSYVSMNMLGFMPTVFPYLEKHFFPFLENEKENILTCEYLIPESMKDMIQEGYAKILLLHTDAKWLGITYLDDKEYVVGEIRKLIDQGVYPENLWK